MTFYRIIFRAAAVVTCVLGFETGPKHVSFWSGSRPPKPTLEAKLEMLFKLGAVLTKRWTSATNLHNEGYHCNRYLFCQVYSSVCICLFGASQGSTNCELFFFLINERRQTDANNSCCYSMFNQIQIIATFLAFIIQECFYYNGNRRMTIQR